MLSLACNQSQCSGCHDDDSNRLATSEHVRVSAACLEFESTPAGNSESG